MKSSMAAQTARHQTWQAARGPLLGLMIGILLARVGLKEMTIFHYFRDQEVQKARVENKSANRSVDVDLLDTLMKRDPR